MNLEIQMETPNPEPIVERISIDEENSLILIKKL